MRSLGSVLVVATLAACGPGEDPELERLPEAGKADEPVASWPLELGPGETMTARAAGTGGYQFRVFQPVVKAEVWLRVEAAGESRETVGAEPVVALAPLGSAEYTITVTNLGFDRVDGSITATVLGGGAAALEDQLRRFACLSCHAIDRKLVGPAFRDVARRYAGDPTAPATLVGRVLDGGTGSWGMVPMPPNRSYLTEAEAWAVVEYILALP